MERCPKGIWGATDEVLWSQAAGVRLEENGQISSAWRRWGGWLRKASRAALARAQ